MRRFREAPFKREGLGGNNGGGDGKSNGFLTGEPIRVFGERSKKRGKHTRNFAIMSAEFNAPGVKKILFFLFPKVKILLKNV